MDTNKNYNITLILVVTALYAARNYVKRETIINCFHDDRFINHKKNKNMQKIAITTCYKNIPISKENSTNNVIFQMQYFLQICGNRQ